MGAAIRANPNISHSAGPMRAANCSVDLDTELMYGVREGDVQAYALLLRRHQRPLIHFLQRIVQSEHVAEELAQEVFLRVYRARETYEPTAKFNTWLFRIATHVAINWLRDGKHEKNALSIDEEVCGGVCRELVDRSSSIEERLLAKVRIREIRDAIDRLPANQRTAVLMHKYQELAYSQIAAALKCSEGAVKSLLFRAYERLRAQLTDGGG